MEFTFSSSVSQTCLRSKYLTPNSTAVKNNDYFKGRVFFVPELHTLLLSLPSSPPCSPHTSPFSSYLIKSCKHNVSPPCPALSVQLAAISLLVNTVFSLPVRWCCSAGVWRNGRMERYAPKWASPIPPVPAELGMTARRYRFIGIDVCWTRCVVYCNAPHVVKVPRGGDANICVRDAESAGRMEWEREQMEVREKVKRVKWEWKRDDITEKMLSWIQGLLDERGPQCIIFLSLFYSFSLSWDVQCRSCSHPYG